MYFLYNKIKISRAPRLLSVSIKVIIGSSFMWYVYKYPMRWDAKYA
jgi:hypothetical protein